MEQKQQQICGDSIIYDGLPPISAKYPWMFAHNPDVEDGQIFYNLDNPLSKYHCRIPELLGKRIRGDFHGWVILSSHPHNNNLTFSLWNPDTSEIICLPPLILKDGDYESIGECCLSSSPHDPSSILLLTRTNKPTFVFIRLHCKRKKVGWIEMSYDSQLKRITSKDGLLVYNLTCWNGKVFALNDSSNIATFVIKIDILVRDREVLINLSLLSLGPFCPIGFLYMHSYLKGTCAELFFIRVGFHDKSRKKTPGGVYVCKLNMTHIKYEMEVFKGLDMTNNNWEDMIEELKEYMEISGGLWEELVDLKDAIFFVDVSCGHSVFYRSTIDSKLGGFIHIRGKMGEILYSYHVKKKTISLSYMPSLVLPTRYVSMWKFRLEDDHVEAMCPVDFKQDEEDKEVELNESPLLNLPFPILEIIMEFCVGVEYMNFRATSKLCHLAAPVIPWNNGTEFKRLQTYSLVSPWLVVVDKNQGLLSFSDPFGGNYFVKNIQVSIHHLIYYIDNETILCSRFGWLLFYHNTLNCLVFCNPFTNDLRKLPDINYNLRTVCFSAPPTSPDCMVVGFSSIEDEWHVSIYFVARESCWCTLSVDAKPNTLRFPTFKNQDLYALGNEGKLIVFKDLGKEDYSLKPFEAQAPRSCCKSLAKYYLMTCDQHILLVVVGELGELVEVFKRNEATKEWEEIDGLGRHMIFICGTTCICIEAKIPEMENKIYFPRLHTKNGKILFYSLETCMYHTFTDDKIIAENFKDFFGTDNHVNPHAWIEPSWC